MSQLSFYKTIFEAKWLDRPGSQRKIAKVQANRLKKLLLSSKRNVPFQARRLGDLDEASFSKIRPTGKQEMMQFFSDTVDQMQLRKIGLARTDLEILAANPKIAPPWFRGKILVSATSGTTGVSGAILNSRKTWAIQKGAVFSRTCRHAIPLHRFNILRPYRMAFFVIDSPWSISFQAADDSKQANSLLAKVRCFSLCNEKSDLLDRLAEFQPDYFQSYPNYLEMFADLKLKGTDFGFCPKVLSSMGDLLDKSQREKLSLAFPESKIVDHYGTTECQPIANSCKLGKLHLNSDYSILEPVDEDDQPAAQGQFSDHALLTNLANDFQPYIRYRLTDRIRIINEPCECGCPFPIVEVKGRGYPKLAVTDNQGQPTFLLGDSILEGIFKTVGLSTFLIGYHQENHLEISFCLLPNFNRESTQAEIVAFIKQLLHVSNCDRSVKLTYNLIKNHGPTPKNYKKKIFDVTYKPTSI